MMAQPSDGFLPAGDDKTCGRIIICAARGCWTTPRKQDLCHAPVHAACPHPFASVRQHSASHSGLRESHICGMSCQVPTLEEAVQTEKSPGDGFWAGTTWMRQCSLTKTTPPGCAEAVAAGMCRLASETRNCNGTAVEPFCRRPVTALPKTASLRSRTLSGSPDPDGTLLTIASTPIAGHRKGLGGSLSQFAGPDRNQRK